MDLMCILIQALPQNCKSQICQFPNPPIPKPLITDLAIEKSDKRQIRQFFFQLKDKSDNFFIRQLQIWQKKNPTKDKSANFFYQLKDKSVNKFES